MVTASPIRRLAVPFVAALGLVGMFAPMASAGVRGIPAPFTVQLDAQPPAGEPWEFQRVFPHALSVHSGDVILSQWAGTGAPHTATFVPAADAETWRQQHQGPGGDYSFIVPDSAVGGDDPELVLNPAVVAPSSFSCGGPENPCAFDGSSVVNSGFQFSDPSNQPAFAVQVTAPVGSYSMLCLVHPGMEIPVRVVSHGTVIPSPAAVTARANDEVEHAIDVDGPTADAQAQQVLTTDLGGGHTRWTITAGGFSNQVSADEFVDSGLTIRVGDQLTITGKEEIHTATTPLEAVSRCRSS
jgi:hypothetical protein